MHHSDNLLLAALSAPIPSGLLKQVSLSHGQVLFEPGETIAEVLFPYSSAVSLVVDLKTGGPVEAALVGREGAVGAGAALRESPAGHRAVIRIAGEALSGDATSLRSLAADGHSELRSMLLEAEHHILIQAQQSAACNVAHRIEQRLARWLLRARDATGMTVIPVTQESLAGVLGVRRSSVSIIANSLLKAGVIEYRRGSIHIKDSERLNAIACECYDAVRRSAATFAKYRTEALHP